jgi:hypothetical protein
MALYLIASGEVGLYGPPAGASRQSKPTKPDGHDDAYSHHIMHPPESGLDRRVKRANIRGSGFWAEGLVLDDAIDRFRQMVDPVSAETLLLVGPLGLAGLVLLGLAGNFRARRWAARLGWILLILSLGMLIFAIAPGKAPPNWHARTVAAIELRPIALTSMSDDRRTAHGRSVE